MSVNHAHHRILFRQHVHPGRLAADVPILWLLPRTVHVPVLVPVSASQHYSSRRTCRSPSIASSGRGGGGGGGVGFASRDVYSVETVPFTFLTSSRGGLASPGGGK